MKPIIPAVVVFAVSIASLSLGSIFLKMGADRCNMLMASGLSFSQALIKSPMLMAGVALMLLQFGGTMVLFKWGWDVSVVVPMFGLCYVLTAFLAKWMLHEPVGWMRWLGILLIVLGIVCVARSGSPAKLP